MQLTIYNGSPRARESSTKIILERFLGGFGQTEGNTSETLYLNQVGKQRRFVEAFEEAECVLVAFPLYCDSMPSIVKVFIESLAPLCGRKDNPDLIFLVHSGFPEALHSRPLERYLARLCTRLGCNHIGTIIRGNTNRIAIQPGFVKNGVLKMFENLGRGFGQNRQLDPRLISKLAKPEKLGGFSLTMMRLLDAVTQLPKRYWNDLLKDNGVFDSRFDKPYERN